MDMEEKNMDQEEKNDYEESEPDQKKRKATDDSSSSESESVKKKRPNDDENEEHAAEEDETATANKPTELEEEDNPFDLSSDDDDDDEDEDENEDIAMEEKAQSAANDNVDALKKNKAELLQELNTMEKEKSHENAADKKTSLDEKLDKLATSTSTKQELEKTSIQSSENSAKEALRRKKLEQIEEESKKMQVLMANFSEEQLNRYELFRRSAFQKSTVKKIIQTVCGKSVSQSVVIAMSGIAKVFVGEIVEKALDVKQKWGDEGPLQPKHLREAYRLFKNTNKLSYSAKFKRDSIF